MATLAKIHRQIEMAGLAALAEPEFKVGQRVQVKITPRGKFASAVVMEVEQNGDRVYYTVKFTETVTVPKGSSGGCVVDEMAMASNTYGDIRRG